MPNRGSILRSELKYGLAVEDLEVCIVGVVKSIALKKAVIPALVLLVGQGAVVLRAQWRQFISRAEGPCRGGAKAQGPARLVALIRVTWLGMVEHDAGLLLVGCHLFELLSMGELWPAG